MYGNQTACHLNCFQPGEPDKALVGAFSVIVKISPKVRCELYWTMWVWVLRGWSVLSTARPPPVTRSALPTWAPLSPAQLEPWAAATHQLILIETPSSQHQPGPGPGSQAAVCDGGDFTTHLSCFTASSGLGADALCVFANLLTTLHTTHSMQTLATLPSSQLIVC